jgi:hypothetical protein
LSLAPGLDVDVEDCLPGGEPEAQEATVEGTASPCGVPSGEADPVGPAASLALDEEGPGLSNCVFSFALFATKPASYPYYRESTLRFVAGMKKRFKRCRFVAHLHDAVEDADVQAIVDASGAAPGPALTWCWKRGRGAAPPNCVVAFKHPCSACHARPMVPREEHSVL